MNCPSCGAILSEGAAFCPNCGQPVGAQPEYRQPEQSAYQSPYQQPEQSAYQSPYQSPYQQPYQNQYQQQGAPVKSGAYLTWSIIVTVLCCWPFGIPAIVNAARINKCNEQGDYLGAEAAAKKSKTWTIVSACVGFVLGIAVGLMNFYLY